MASEFYKLVPKELGANLEYRIKLRKRADKDHGFRAAMMAACKHDILLFLNGFAFVYEPRPRRKNGNLLPKTLPFITWPHQDPAILSIREHIGFSDIGVEKSRGEGLSWLCDYFAIHDWLFNRGSKVGLVSSSEKKTDDPGNMDSMMAKIDWALAKLPVWMVGVKDTDWIRNKSDHAFVHHVMETQINGFAATDDLGRAGRYSWFGIDELGSWERPKDKNALESSRSSTDSRLVISTPGGSEGAYYEFMHTPSNIVKVVVDWKDNPTKNRGLYRLEDGKPIAVEPLNPLPKEYDPPSKATLDLFSRLRLKGFKLEKSTRSPWYDRECDKADATPQSIAKELDRDYGGSTYRIFLADFFAAAEKAVRTPVTRGNLTFHPETLEPQFDQGNEGQCLLWAPLDANNKPAKHKYAVAADISSGLGGSYTSNSVVTVIDLLTMEQVFEFASNTIEPADFADYCIALCKLYHDAYLSWEVNGPGGGFTRQVIKRQYQNTYYRTAVLKRSKKRTKELGWLTRKETKEVMFSTLIKAVITGEFIPRSAAMIKECHQYVRLKGKIEHVGSVRTEDDSSTGEAHGDRVIATCICLQAALDRPLDVKLKEEEQDDEPPYNTMAHRQKLHDQAQAETNEEVWDDRTNWDLSRPGGMVGNLAKLT